MARLETLLEQEAIQEPVGGWELMSPCMEHLDASIYIYDSYMTAKMLTPLQQDGGISDVKDNGHEIIFMTNPGLL